MHVPDAPCAASLVGTVSMEGMTRSVEISIPCAGSATMNSRPARSFDGGDTAILSCKRLHLHQERDMMTAYVEV